jgi:hypothetical protein
MSFPMSKYSINTKGAHVIALDTMCLPFAHSGVRRDFIDTSLSPSQAHQYDDSASGISIHIKEWRGYGRSQLGVELPHRLEGQTNESDNDPPPSIWPRLRTISVSSIDEEDIVWICMLVASCANCAKEYGPHTKCESFQAYYASSVKFGSHPS